MSPRTTSSAQPGARRRRAARRPRDHGSSCAAAPAASARPPPRRRSALRAAERGRDVVRAHHRPGAPARPVAGAHRARQHPAPVDRASTRRRRLARRDDARHEADLRRGRRGARRPRAGRRDPGEPVLPVAVELASPGTQEYMAMEKLGQLRARAEAEHVGPDRRRHPAAPVGARLPRRAAAARVVPRRPVHPPARRAGARPAAAAYFKVLSAGFGMFTGVLDQGPRRAGARRRADVRRLARHDVRRLPRAGRGDLRDAPGRRHRVRRGGRARAATRCARRRTSSSGSRPSDAARRAGAQPGADHRGARPRRRRGDLGRGAARDGIAVVGDGGAAAHPRRPGGDARASARGCASGSPRRTAAVRGGARCRRWPTDVHDLAGLRAVGDALARARLSALLTAAARLMRRGQEELA